MKARWRTTWPAAASWARWKGRWVARALNPALRPVLEALHHVLAGGEVSVHILQRGNADIVNELNLRAERATEESSTFDAAGDTLSATV
ncbi:hypothetical protein ACLEPN_20970 [Myxococcus sp. 1LA]